MPLSDDIYDEKGRLAQGRYLKPLKAYLLDDVIPQLLSLHVERVPRSSRPADRFLRVFRTKNVDVSLEN